MGALRPPDVFSLMLVRCGRPLVPRGNAAGDRRGGAALSVLIIVQNLPVPFDRRVWLECQALVDAGHAVSVICPKGPGDPDEETIDGVTLYKYPPPAPGRGVGSFVNEYLYSFVQTSRLVGKAWRRRPFQVLQACNPPDIFWPIALALRLRGVRFVFDHHDLCPELYESRFSDGSKALYWALRLLEWCTYRSAHHVVSTNDSYRAIAIRRGNKRVHEVTVVRTGPDPDRLVAVEPESSLKRGRRYLVAYLGVMGPQDGVDLALRAAHHIVHQLGHDDVSFTFMGSGDSIGDLLELRDQLQLSDFVDFSGRVPDSTVAAVLSTADVALCPDPKNPLNDVSTMNKTMEYMSFAVPVVAFDLLETRVSAGDAAVYATPNVIEEFAELILKLLEDEQRRLEMGIEGRSRVVGSLAWQHQRDSYLRVCESLRASNRHPTTPVPERSGAH